MDGVLRVYAQNRFLIVMNVGRLALTLALIGWAMSRFGLEGAIATTVVAQVLAKIAATARIAGLLQVRAAQVLPWRSLGGITAAALVSAGPALWVQARIGAPPFLAGALIGGTYALTYGAIVALALGLSPAAVGRRLRWQGTEGR